MAAVYADQYHIVDKIGPVNFVIQRSPRADQLIVHVDKQKLMHGATPVSWLTDPRSSTTDLDL